MGDARADIMGLSDYVYQRTRSRLAGLDDDEYFWEPVAGCSTIRRTESAAYRADDADRPPANVLRPVTGAGDPPFTTIAWRLWHLTGCYGGKRNPQWLGVERPAGGFERGDPGPATAAEAIAVLEHAHAFWQDLLRALPAASWWEPLGPVAGPVAEEDRASLVLHQLDEQIHHGAELGVLRDLYLHNRSASRSLPGACGAPVSGGQAHPYHESAAGRRPQAELAAVSGDDGAHDRQAEPGAVPGPLLAGPAERLKQAVQVRAGDPLPAVGDLQDHTVPFGAGAGSDPAVRAVVLDGVADQVAGQLAEQRRVSAGGRRGQSGAD